MSSPSLPLPPTPLSLHPPLHALPGGRFHGCACISRSVKDVAASCLFHGRLPGSHRIFPSALVFLVNFHLSLPFLPPPSVYLLMNCVPRACFFFSFFGFVLFCLSGRVLVSQHAFFGFGIFIPFFGECVVVVFKCFCF